MNQQLRISIRLQWIKIWLDLVGRVFWTSHLTRFVTFPNRPKAGRKVTDESAAKASPQQANSINFVNCDLHFSTFSPAIHSATQLLASHLQLTHTYWTMSVLNLRNRGFYFFIHKFWSSSAIILITAARSDWLGQFVVICTECLFISSRQQPSPQWIIRRRIRLTDRPIICRRPDHQASQQ